MLWCDSCAVYSHARLSKCTCTIGRITLCYHRSDSPTAMRVLNRSVRVASPFRDTVASHGKDKSTIFGSIVIDEMGIAFEVTCVRFQFIAHTIAAKNSKTKHTSSETAEAPLHSVVVKKSNIEKITGESNFHSATERKKRKKRFILIISLH